MQLDILNFCGKEEGCKPYFLLGYPPPTSLKWFTALLCKQRYITTWHYW